MPQTTPQRQKRWRTLFTALNYLQERGWAETTNGWMAPSPGYPASMVEADAILYLAEEWDYYGTSDESREIWPDSYDEYFKIVGFPELDYIDPS